MKHVRICNANVEPVFFAYPDNEVLDSLLARYAATKPEYDSLHLTMVQTSVLG